ncbi:MAG: porin family protein [Rikenellaceae bacterium]
MLDKRDIFDETLKKRYDNFHEEATPTWDELFAGDKLKFVPRRTLMMRRAIGLTAIAALLATGLIIGISFINNHPISEIKNRVETISETPIPIVESDDAENLGAIIAINHSHVDAIKTTISNNLASSKPKTTYVAETKQDSTPAKPTPERIENKQEKSIKKAKEKEPKNYQSWQKDSRPRKNEKKLSLTLGTSLMPTANGGQNMGSMASNVMMPMIVNIDNYRNSVNFESDDYKHKFPINASLMVRYNFFDRLSISSGINYSYLESSAENIEKLTYSLKQRINYIGIPLSVSYDFLRAKRFSMYGAFGGMAEFNVGATNEIKSYSNGKLVRTQKEKIDINNTLFSLQCGVGLKYNIVEKFGVFVEPGLNYVFNNKNQPITYKTKTPMQFNLKLGFSIDL